MGLNTAEVISLVFAEPAVRASESVRLPRAQFAEHASAEWIAKRKFCSKKTQRKTKEQAAKTI
jgi:hypothetical protein